jgi:hypothetical protein
MKQDVEDRGGVAGARAEDEEGRERGAAEASEAQRQPEEPRQEARRGSERQEARRGSERQPEEASAEQPHAVDLLGKALAEHFGVEAAKSARYQLFQLYQRFQLYAACVRASAARPCRVLLPLFLSLFLSLFLLSCPRPPQRPRRRHPHVRAALSRVLPLAPPARLSCALPVS